MRIVLSVALAAATLVATPAAAQERVDVGACFKSEQLEATIRRTQNLTEVTSIECDRVVTQVGESSVYSLEGQVLLTFTGHAQGENMLVDTIVFAGQPPVAAIKGICIGGQRPDQSAMVCSATYLKDGETVAIVAAFGGRPE